MSVTLSQRAADEVKRTISQQDLPENTTLRVSVVAGGCSGFEYSMDFEQKANEAEDVVVESSGIQIAIDKKSAELLAGTVIDYHEDLMNRGFVFNNPLAVQTCGCGTSFQVKEGGGAQPSGSCFRG